MLQAESEPYLSYYTQLCVIYAATTININDFLKVYLSLLICFCINCLDPHQVQIFIFGIKVDLWLHYKSCFIIIINKAMSNYLQKYHLKKVEPVKSRPRINYIDYLKMHHRPEKIGVVKVPTKRKIPPHRNYFQQEEDRPPNTTHKIERHAKLQSSPLIEDFAAKHKRDPTPTKNMHRQHKSLNFKSGKDSSTGAKILNTIQDFLSKIMRNNQGCSCGDPCPWSNKFFRWVDVPLEIIKDHYIKLLIRWESMLQPYPQDMPPEDPKGCEEGRKNVKQIMKDVDRTQSDSATFQNPVFKEKQRKILMSYATQDPKVGYIQGMNLILSGILYHVKDEIKSFAIFRNLILNVRSMYLHDFKECYVHINKVRELIAEQVHDLYEVFEEVGVDLNIVCLPWILSLLTCMVPLEQLHLIYEGFIREQWTFIYKACLAIFIYHKDTLIALYEAGDIIALLSPTNEDKNGYDWEDIIIYANSITL